MKNNIICLAEVKTALNCMKGMFTVKYQTVAQILAKRIFFLRFNIREYNNSLL